MTGIIVAFPNAENGKSIRNILMRNGYKVLSICTNGAQVLKETDRLQDGLVLCTARLPDMMYWELKQDLPPEVEMIVISSKAQWDELGDRKTLNLVSPLKVHELLSTVEMVMGTISRRKRKRKQQPRTRTKHEQAIIDRAKGLLMERNSMSEEEAHRYLQKTSMDNGTSFTETAQMILSMLDS